MMSRSPPDRDGATTPPPRDVKGFQKRAGEDPQRPQERGGEKGLRPGRSEAAPNANRSQVPASNADAPAPPQTEKQKGRRTRAPGAGQGPGRVGRSKGAPPARPGSAQAPPPTMHLCVCQSALVQRARRGAPEEGAEEEGRAGAEEGRPAAPALALDRPGTGTRRAEGETECQAQGPSEAPPRLSPGRTAQDDRYVHTPTQPVALSPRPSPLAITPSHSLAGRRVAPRAGMGSGASELALLWL
ncbi:skin secretory protein xP2-like [Penaeus chinensis]|uniref:skin secretory protein xP2-like n=1 Tax=Penaeus chinensis TaxID=139456 RepID=UPI001FB610D3|nr:skin secretory protein xP2-like [Penaeus chinensis]